MSLGTLYSSQNLLLRSIILHNYINSDHFFSFPFLFFLIRCLSSAQFYFCYHIIPLHLKHYTLAFRTCSYRLNCFSSIYSSVDFIFSSSLNLLLIFQCHAPYTARVCISKACIFVFIPLRSASICKC